MHFSYTAQATYAHYVTYASLITKKIIRNVMMEQSEVEAILARLRAHLGVRNNAQLAKTLGISPNAVSNWIRRGSINWNLIVERVPGLDAAWLRYGDNRRDGGAEVESTTLHSDNRERQEAASAPGSQSTHRLRLDPTAIFSAVDGFRQTFGSLSHTQLAAILEILGYRNDQALYIAQTDPPEKVAALITRILLDRLGYDTDRLPG